MTNTNSTNNENSIFEQLKLKQDEIETLKTTLEFEQICNKIERILDKERHMKEYDVTLQISRDFLKYVEDHPLDAVLDYDTDDNYTDSTRDDGERECPFTVEDFCGQYNWCPETVRDIKNTFNI